MNDHYYTQEPQSKSRPAEASFTYRGHALTLETDAGVFSRGELDAGTRILLAALPQEIHGQCLDLGCGWGAIGISVALCNPDCTVTFADINQRALALCEKNAARYGIPATVLCSDGFSAIAGTFDTILTNPPIRAGKRTIYRMFADGAAHLRPQGALYLVIRKQQGAPSAKQYLESIFPSVEVIDKSGGYWVLRCIKEE